MAEESTPLAGKARDRLLDSASRLFCRYGINAIGVDAVVLGQRDRRAGRHEPGDRLHLRGGDDGGAATQEVIDDGRAYHGTDEIRAWLGRSASEYTYTTELTRALKVDDAHYDVVQHLEGGIVKEILDRAREHGVETLAFTIDLAVLGTRYRDIRNGMAGGLGPWGKLRSGLIDYAIHPGWAVDVGLLGGPHGFGNLANYVKQSKNPRDYLHWTGTQFDASVTWKDIEWLRQIWPGNLVLKGVLDVEDARQSVAIGADGMIVSNHGGRQLDGAASTAAMLPRIADAVGDQTTLLVDGGIRSGQDLVRALALGAKAALVGRPWVMALAAGGEAALTRMLGLMKQDMRTALGLSGAINARDVDRKVLLAR